jgi:hypothetical protein
MNGKIITETSNQSKRFPWDLALLGSFGYAFAVLLRSYENVGKSLGDTDDALRLVQVRQYVDGASWYDLSIGRLNPPDGYISHWSRIPDAVMAGLMKFFGLFMSNEQAELWMRVVYPSIWLVPACIALCLLSFRLVNNRLAVPLSILIVAASPAAAAQFQVGRIDHHGAQISLSFIAFVLLCLGGTNRWYAAVSGVVCAVLVAVGLEALPFVVLAAAVAAFGYVFSGNAPGPLRSFCVSLGVGCFVALAVSLPIANWGQMHCDAISLNLVTAISIGCLCVLLASYLQWVNANSWRRCVAMTISAAAALAVYLFMYPDCRFGPFGFIDPELKQRWLSKVMEVQPLISFQWLQQDRDAISVALTFLPVIVGAVWLIRDQLSARDPKVLFLVLACCLSFLLAIPTLRMVMYSYWFATPLYCVLIFALFKRFGEKRKLLAGLLAIICLPVVISNGFVSAASVLKPLGNQGVVNANQSGSCVSGDAFAKLAQMPKSRVMAELDLGPHVLAHTPHSVAAAPYHRLGRNIIDSIDFFEGTVLEKARQIAIAKGIDLVVMCAPVQPFEITTDRPSLQELLASGKSVDWLVPVEHGADQKIWVYRVAR